MIWSVGYERALLFAAISIAAFALGVAFLLSYRTGDPHWVNRSGAAIAAAEGIIAVAEFHRRTRLSKIHDVFIARKLKQIADGETSMDVDEAHNILEAEISRAELHVLVVAVVLAVIGELLHGFGDLFFECLRRVV